jgi:RNA polymerase sigma-70 factor (ECF subfamily)
MSVGLVHMRWTLDTDQLRSIEIGVRGKLRSARIPESFIDRQTEDLVQQAVAEYASASERGIKITNASGWIVNTAYRRAIDQLRHEQHETEGATEDIAVEATDETSPLPDEEALDHIQVEQLHRAINRLSTTQKQALSLYYFEERTTRDAAVALGWSEPTFRRRRDAAIRNLRERFGVTVPEFEIGLAAWLSLTTTDSRFASITSNLTEAAESLRSGAMAAIERGREFATRLLSSGGGETAIGIGSPAGKAAAGVCATALAACTATGVIGPGVAGVDLIGPTKPKPSIEKRMEPTRPETSRPPARSSESTPNQDSTRPSDSRQKTNASSTSKSGSGQKRTRQARQTASSQFGVESSASTTPAESAPAATPASPPPSAPSPSPSPDQAAQQQFGLP